MSHAFGECMNYYASNLDWSPQLPLPLNCDWVLIEHLTVHLGFLSEGVWICFMNIIIIVATPRPFRKATSLFLCLEPMDTIN